MIQTRPVSDLKNKFQEIEEIVSGGEPVCLTQNGYGTMVLLSLDSYAKLIGSIETALDEADCAAAGTDRRMAHEDVFDNLWS